MEWIALNVPPNELKIIYHNDADPVDLIIPIFEDMSKKIYMIDNIFCITSVLLFFGSGT